MLKILFIMLVSFAIAYSVIMLSVFYVASKADRKAERMRDREEQDGR